MLITETKDLKKFLDSIKKSEFLAVDTEFHREKTYFPKLCLVQIANEDTMAAIDTLADGLDVKMLMDFLHESKAIKVFHAAKQDLEIIMRLSGTPLENIFDTQIAAMALGIGEQVGYGNLISAVLGKNLSKGQQITNWTKRPLTEAQIKYALDDVKYLVKAYKKIITNLDAKNRTSWVKEDMLSLSVADNIVTPDENLWKGIKVRERKPRIVTCLKELAVWREKHARDLDVPRGFIAKDEVLGNISRVMPVNVAELSNIRGIGSDFIKKYADEIISIVKKVKDMDSKDYIPVEDNSNKQGVDSNLLALANLFIKIRAKEEDISARFISSSADLSDFLLGASNDLPLNKGWRWKLFGEDLVKLKKGELTFGVSAGRVKIFR